MWTDSLLATVVAAAGAAILILAFCSRKRTASREQTRRERVARIQRLLGEAPVVRYRHVTIRLKQ